MHYDIGFWGAEGILEARIPMHYDVMCFEVVNCMYSHGKLGREAKGIEPQKR